MNEILKRLLTPEGVRDLLPDLAGRKRKLEELIQDIFSRWGYREVSTPAFEYSVNFDTEMKADLEENLYRFPDERGRTLVLRPDFTLPLARVAATHLAREAKPLRLCYGGSIFRYAGGLQGKQRELTQAGVELMGAGTAESDAEIIALAAEVLQAAGLLDFTLCLGHVGFLDNLLAAYGVTPEAGEKIKHFFSKKDFVSLRELVQSLPLASEAAEAVLAVPGLRGGAEVLEEARKLLPPGADMTPLLTLQDIWAVLADYGVSRFVTLDLGMVRMLNYYTGMVFEGYTVGLGYPLCGGGRYDQLLVNFGINLPAVGFAVSVDHLLTVLERRKLLPEKKPSLYLAYSAGSRAAALAAAQALRKSGEKVVVSVQESTGEEAARQGRALGALRLLYYHGGKCTETALDSEGGGKDATLK
ncbi:MAG: ATP phosphoribosyltransferase regulatory subunit [Firmicutes bacterium]|nr:ATP phosphoribosyltransferase regulatory subunit [Bacillota bacterium]